MSTSNATILGRSFGLHVLDALRERPELSFSALLSELGMNRATLSRTLADLVTQGYVDRRAFGRHRYYTMTDQGAAKLKELSNPILTEDRIAQLVFKDLGERGVLERYPGVSREAILQASRSKVASMIKKIEQELDEELRKGG